MWEWLQWNTLQGVVATIVPLVTFTMTMSDMYSPHLSLAKRCILTDMVDDVGLLDREAVGEVQRRWGSKTVWKGCVRRPLAR